MKCKNVISAVVVFVLVVTVFILLAVYSEGEAKRGKPPLIKPIQISGIEYRVRNTVDTQGIVEAWQTNKLLWQVKIYHPIWVPFAEEDTQWNFIKSMSIGNVANNLVIVNEQGAQFNLDTITKKVTRVKGSFLRGW